MRLHRFLAGRKDAEATTGWWVGRICDEFKVPPSVALREWRRDPDLVRQVMQERGYAYWYHRLMDAKDDSDWPAAGKEPMADLVADMHLEFIRAGIRKRAKGTT